MTMHCIQQTNPWTRSPDDGWPDHALVGHLWESQRCRGKELGGAVCLGHVTVHRSGGSPVFKQEVPEQYCSFGKDGGFAGCISLRAYLQQQASCS